MVSEFDLIRRYFTRPARGARLGVGDDAALLPSPNGQDIVVSTDTLVSGVHFFPDADPRALGHKALAVNLSDLAAMGAKPRWALLAITVPDANERWLAEFSDGLFRLADEYDVELVGGDTTRGPRSITITVIGEIGMGKALTRSGARVGDELWVSGVLGSAALGVLHLKGDLRLKGLDLEHCLTRLHRPVPRVALGCGLVGIASAAIDVSDGLAADVGHIAESSGVGFRIEYGAVPCTPEVEGLKNVPAVRRAVLAGGDDYELAFTAPPRQSAAITALSARLGIGLTRIGTAIKNGGVQIFDDAGKPIALEATGFDHFR